jgi:hypothetical protein
MQEEFMSEQEEFLSPKHKRLLNIAIWAKYLAWFVLAIYILSAMLVIPQDMAFFQRFEGSSDYWRIVAGDRLGYVIDIGSSILKNLLAGAIYFVVLRGISVGLSMIVETDINYREKQEGTK